MNSELILFTLALLFGFYMAWNIGAIDVSNAMGTSIGSKALTLKQAILIAAILEFSGAFLLGSNVTSTIHKGIVDIAFFNQEPLLLVLGMTGALLATSLWLNLACYLKLPVSTTHAIVGAVVGFGLIVSHGQAVLWSKLSLIAFSWLLTPLFSGSIAFLIFTFLQKKILFSLNPLRAAKKLSPFLVGLAFTTFTLSLIFHHLTMISTPLAILLSLSFSSLLAFLSHFFIQKIHPEAFPETLYSPEEAVMINKAKKHLLRLQLSSSEEIALSTKKVLQEVESLSDQIHAKVQLSKSSAQYVNVEKIFAYLQIISACMVAFAHGANDVANAIGPIVAVSSVLASSLPIAAFFNLNYILLLGGVGIVIGLSTWGWRIIETVGKKITELTPTRGFSAEFASALTILIATQFGLPISTTHSLVGAIIGIGLARGLSSLNFKVVKEILLTWLITIPISALLSILIFVLLKALLY